MRHGSGLKYALRQEDKELPVELASCQLAEPTAAIDQIVGTCLETHFNIIGGGSLHAKVVHEAGVLFDTREDIRQKPALGGFSCAELEIGCFEKLLASVTELDVAACCWDKFVLSLDADLNRELAVTKIFDKVKIHAEGLLLKRQVHIRGQSLVHNHGVFICKVEQLAVKGGQAVSRHERSLHATAVDSVEPLLVLLTERIVAEQQRWQGIRPQLQSRLVHLCVVNSDQQM